ncbi:Bax inhibitor-1/YccA family protein [Duncaniella freteri]|uniref:Bax inhibitor-1/YccA family protein n=1 Tax=Duncaniella freteri TaxID=2530391 RepID=UPI0025746C85|nr:Bax inhibitor-1/YccA family protein [Duncaniella freteri]
MYNETPTPPPYNGGGYQSASQIASTTSSVMKRVYLKMTLGLLVTAFISMFCAGSASYMQFMLTHSWFYWGLFIAELVLVFTLSARISKMASGTATLLFYAFAAINGMALAPIFLLYTATSIAKTFFICAGTFGAMSIYGYFTTQDLTKWGNFLFYALIGLIIASVVNIFTKSTGLDWVISCAGVLIFVGLTAWDTQKIKQMALYAPSNIIGHLATLGALSLYLDFINLFLYLLRFFGSSRD